MAGAAGWHKETIVGLHSPAFPMLSLIAMGRLASIATFTTREVQHARELIGRVQQLTVAVVPIHDADP